MRWLSGVLLIALAIPAMAADRNVNLNRSGANPGRTKAKVKDRVVWRGNDWRVEFEGGRSPCQNGKMTFSSRETGQNRMCIISVKCSAAGSADCTYKYRSQADGGPFIDPEIEVEF